MHLVCHKEYLGWKDPHIEGVVQAKMRHLGINLMWQMGKDVQGDRRNAVQGKMLQKTFLLSSKAKYRLIKNLKHPSGEEQECGWRKSLLET